MRNVKLLMLSATLLCGMSSCKKWLDLKPQDGIVRQEFWKTKEQVDAAVTGIYASLLRGTTSNSEIAPTELFFLWGEGRADMVSPGFRAEPDEIEFVNYNIQPTNRYTSWRTIYQTINYCNTVLELAPGVLTQDNTFTQDRLNRAMGEALAIRSLMYFYLTKTFKEVPLKLTATISDQNLEPLGKATSTAILNQIESDLKKAEGFLPVSYGNRETDKGRVTRFTAQAMLADVYLWMDKYAEAVVECDKLINSGQFGLVAGTSSMFNSLYFEGNSAESIFELQFDVQKLNPFYFMHLAGTRRWGAATHIMDEVYGIDVVNAVPQMDLRGEGNALRASDLSIWKFIGANSSGTSIRSADQSFANWIFYRYADVLLMKAEATNQLDKPLEASRLVKTIRERAKAFDFSAAMDSTNKSAMEAYILEERQREFAFEGKRWFDVLRHAKRANYGGRKYLLDMAAISVPSDRRQVAFNKLQDNNSHYLPINLYELQTNKLLVQNPFYK